MRFERFSLENCNHATGAVVVIDVLRAFSTASYAFAAGAEAIIAVGTVEETFAIKAQHPTYLALGEVQGLPVPGFDLWNSPSELQGWDFSGRRLIQRTTNGTKGIVRSVNASTLLAGGFCNAAATARYLHCLQPSMVSFVITGVGPNGKGDEDYALADYLEALLRGDNTEPAPFLERVRGSQTGQIFADPLRPEFPAADLDYCARADIHDFAMQVRREDAWFVIRPVFN